MLLKLIVIVAVAMFGASNKKDLKILSSCEGAIGTVKHTKKMNDGGYKFALKVRHAYKSLLNKINN